jgi:spectinomycin phosphotransferase
VLEKPDLKDEAIIACLQDQYGLHIDQLAFLPLGADLNTAVYRAVSDQGAAYFVKLRRGAFDEIAVTLPHWLSEWGIVQIIAPLPTKLSQTTQSTQLARIGPLWANVDAYKLILYPFIEGGNGYQVELTDRLWVEFGKALKSIHTAPIPSALLRAIPQESYAPQGRAAVKSFMERITQVVFDDPVAVETAAFLGAHRPKVLDLVRRAERLAAALQAQPPEVIVCHSDLHAGNLLITSDDTFYIVDWDSPILAPKERDLMFAGGGQFDSRRTPQEEATLFYRGYGPTPINAAALAYYRYERIIQDLAVECEQIFLSTAVGEDRPQALHWLKSNFQPKGVLEIALQMDRSPY